MMRFSLLSAVFLLAACGLNPSAQAAQSDASACGKSFSPGMHKASMQAGVLDRTYQVYVPSRWNNKVPRPMVIGLHGGYGTGEEFNEQTKASERADKFNMLLVLPDGYYKSWNAGECCKPAAKLGVRDVRFIESLVEKVSQEYCIDRQSVFATGFSNGAMLAHRIACEKPGLLKAIAPVAGGIMSECKNGGAVAALMIGGKKDPRIFWEGGEFDGSYRPSMKELVKNLSGRNQCSGGEKILKKSAAVAKCHELASCGKQPLRYCGIEGVGHQWPGGKTYWPKKLGANTRAFDATEEIFDFFSRL